MRNQTGFKPFDLISILTYKTDKCSKHDILQAFSEMTNITQNNSFRKPRHLLQSILYVSLVNTNSLLRNFIPRSHIPVQFEPNLIQCLITVKACSRATMVQETLFPKVSFALNTLSKTQLSAEKLVYVRLSTLLYADSHYHSSSSYRTQIQNSLSIVYR